MRTKLFFGILFLFVVSVVRMSAAAAPKVPESITFEPGIEYANPKTSTFNSTWPAPRPATGHSPRSFAYTAAGSAPGRARGMTKCPSRLRSMGMWP